MTADPQRLSRAEVERIRTQAENNNRNWDVTTAASDDVPDWGDIRRLADTALALMDENESLVDSLEGTSGNQTSAEEERDDFAAALRTAEARVDNAEEQAKWQMERAIAAEARIAALERLVDLGARGWTHALSAGAVTEDNAVLVAFREECRALLSEPQDGEGGEAE